ncbi:acyltransferase family protein [Streptomyces sclerotialus]|uniref:acyltransferase family protein n=1 Tax=Streptomyces sclerotialus TaxID=1957 RepID=UPI000A5DCB82
MTPDRADTGGGLRTAPPPPLPDAPKTAQRTAQHAHAPGKRRDAFFDNAKYLAIVLVAVGHSWEPLRAGSPTAAALYDFVFALHMPAFIIVSGYMSRSFEPSGVRLQRLVTGVAVPYLVFETGYSLFKRFADHDPGFAVSLLDPWYLTWFLICLFVWRLTTPLWKAVRWPVPLSLLIACLASVSPSIGDDLDMQRLLQFLPYFVLGLNLRAEHFALLRSRRARTIAVPVLAAAVAFSFWAAPRMNSSWLNHRDAAQELGAPWWAGPVMTLATFGCSLVLVACFLSWVPGRRLWCTALGAGTLYGYLLHGFVVQGSRIWNWYDAAWVHTGWGMAAVTGIAAAVVTLLCTAPVRRLFRGVMEPTMNWAFRADPVQAAARQRAH